MLFLTTIERRNNRINPTGRISGWKPMLHTLTIHHSNRLAAVAY